MTRSSQKILDEWLVVCSQSGDRQAFDRLLQRWQTKLYSYACSLLKETNSAEDVVQEALLVISKDLHKLKDPEAFPKWAYQILHRRVCDWIRIRQRQRRDDSVLDFEDCHIQTGVLEVDIVEAIKSLGSDHYQVIRLFYLDEFSVEEVSQILSISTGTVKSRLFNGRKKLKKIIGE